jgi:hypothetical protein
LHITSTAAPGGLEYDLKCGEKEKVRVIYIDRCEAQKLEPI